ncbi:MAG: carboxylesterase family protein [Thermoanaerobaculia bacterium]|nr:carboxylesterase family protein [Thermoanaerobaculia bacterium]
MRGVSKLRGCAVLAALGLLALLPGGVAAATIGDVVETETGRVRGSAVQDEGRTVRIFRGIPYAAPPVGDLRWRPPQPAARWDGVRDATQWAPRAPQGRSTMGTGGISEDCLHLNVVTAAATAADRQPVMVFFHGGGLSIGTANSPLYNHTALPRKDVVVVTVNSRLGPLGYMAHPALTAESKHGASGNYGTLDLIASLRWVQANIEAFGGDPGNVLIFGESGGGTKTLSLLASPLAEGLFHKAIVESGSASASPERTTTLQAAEAAGEKIAAELGLAAKDDPLAALRAASWEDIVAAAAKVGYRASLTVDGRVLPLSVHETLKLGQQHDVPLIVGANAGEKRELELSVPRLANLMSATAASNTYVYNFSHMPKGWRGMGCIAFHGVGLPYVFGYVPAGLATPTNLILAARSGCKSRQPGADEVDEIVADRTMTMWAQFARTGDPSVEGLVSWPAYTEEQDRYLDIGHDLAVREGIRSSWVAAPAAD